MKALPRLKYELSLAKENNHERLIGVLEELLEVVGGYKSDEKILNYMENVIKEHGGKIAKLMKKGKIKEMEPLFYQQTVYNSYVSELKYKSYRPIYYQTENDPEKSWEIHENSLIFTVDSKKK